MTDVEELKMWKRLAIHYEMGHAADQLGCDRECRGFPYPGMIDCGTCGESFDPTSLREVLFHEHANLSLPVPDIKGKRVR